MSKIKILAGVILSLIAVSAFSVGTLKTNNLDIEETDMLADLDQTKDLGSIKSEQVEQTVSVLPADPVKVKASGEVLKPVKVQDGSSDSQAYLKKRSDELGLPYTLLNRIIECESTWIMQKNKLSSAYGYFQIIDGTEKTTPQYKSGLRKFDPYVNIDMGIWLYQQRGSQPWNASKHCWGS